MPARCVANTDDESRLDAYWSIVSDLVALIDRTRGFHLADAAVEAAMSDDEVVFLDDSPTVPPTEMSLLNDCNLRLREALHFLLEARAAGKVAATGWTDDNAPAAGEMSAVSV